MEQAYVQAVTPDPDTMDTGTACALELAAGFWLDKHPDEPADAVRSTFVMAATAIYDKRAARR